MRALVTGCAGFIGSHLTESLLADGHAVVGVDAFTDNYERARKLSNLLRARQFDSFELHEADLAEADLAPILESCDTIFHLAAEPGVRSSWNERFEFFLRRNVLATQRLLDAAVAEPERPFVLASSSSIYGDAERLPTPEGSPPLPHSPYGATKLAAENLCRLYCANHGLRTVALRYFTVYGPRQRPDMAFHRFCRKAIDGEPLTVFGDGSQTRDFTFVTDTVRATRAAALHGRAGRAYNVGGGSRVSVRDVLALLDAFSDRPLDVRYGEPQHGDVRHTGADTARARDELGFEARIALPEGVRAEFDWLLHSSGGRGRHSFESRPSQASPRYVFYSNEIVGLGHLRRALAVTSGLAALDVHTSSLIVSGSPVAPFFELPHGTDTVKLPSRDRDADGAPRSRALAVDVGDLSSLRSKIAFASVQAFQPDVVVVDKIPLGPGRELRATLDWVSTQTRRRLVLGLRDIEDSPARVRERWDPDLRAVIEEHFDAVLVYGPDTSPHALRCLGWNDLDVPVHHVGYLGIPGAARPAEDLSPGYLLASAGGGHDGFELLSSLIAAIRREPLPCRTVIVAGPLMSGAELARLRELSHGLEIEVHAFRTDMADVTAGARAAVTMAGYNTVAELMRARKPALLVPRVHPSEEQLTRARALASRGLAEMFHPSDLSGGALREAVGRTLDRPPPPIAEHEYCGGERAARILASLAARETGREPTVDDGRELDAGFAPPLAQVPLR